MTPDLPDAQPSPTTFEMNFPRGEVRRNSERVLDCHNCMYAACHSCALALQTESNHDSDDYTRTEVPVPPEGAGTEHVLAFIHYQLDLIGTATPVLDGLLLLGDDTRSRMQGGMRSCVYCDALAARLN